MRTLQMWSILVQSFARKSELSLTEEGEVIFQAVSYCCMKTFDVDDVSVVAYLLQQHRLLAADEPLVLGFCLVEQATADIAIEVPSLLIGIKVGLKS